MGGDYLRGQGPSSWARGQSTGKKRGKEKRVGAINTLPFRYLVKSSNVSGGAPTAYGKNF